jgi:hypothetical protein
VSARRAAALALLLLGGCVINTRPHLPAEDGADAAYANGATRDTDGGTDSLRDNASARADGAAYDTSVTDDLPVPTMCPDGAPCGGAGGGDASAPLQDSGASIDAVFEVDAAAPQDAADPGPDVSPDASPDASRDATPDTYPDGWPVPDGGLSLEDIGRLDPADV